MTGEAKDSFDIKVSAGGGSYVVQRSGNELRVGRQAGETMLWQPETVPLDQLPPAAREALERGETDSHELTSALEPIIQAFVQRGG